MIDETTRRHLRQRVTQLAATSRVRDDYLLTNLWPLMERYELGQETRSGVERVLASLEALPAGLHGTPIMGARMTEEKAEQIADRQLADSGQRGPGQAE